MRLIRFTLSCAALALTAVSSALAQMSGEDIAIIPRPQVVTRGSGEFTITPTTAIVTDRAFRDVARDLARYVEPATGIELPVLAQSAATRNTIVFRREPALRKSLGAEGYRLVVTPARVTITAPEAAGAFYAVQSIRQLLPAEIFRDAPVQGVAWTMPAVRIEDQPRFAWRGAHLDVGRHFMPKEFVEKYIDLLALHKMNTFHWHLTEDQGWRIEIKKYPRLTQIGAWRNETVVGHPHGDSTDVYDKRRHGGFYTQDDIREVVAYAKQRFVTIVPEIEMPGHSQAAIAAYPSLGNFGDTVPVWTRWGVTPHILNPSDTTIAFMQDVLTEVMALFPGPYIHIGGDEAPKSEWKTSPRAQAKIRELGITPDDPNDPKDHRAEDRLQSWFTTQMDAFLTKHGRRLVGWDEILEGGLAPNAVVMSWRGIAGGLAAAQSGHDVVMTPGSHTYLDHSQTRDRDHEPITIGGFLPIDTVYAYEPTAQLPAEFWPHVLGTQAQLWTEYMPDAKQVEYMAFPRMAALAEVAWTFRERRDFADFSARLPKDLRRLDALDVNYYGRGH